jgi:methoxymalonate biosynthesis acyl carrier protein
MLKQKGKSMETHSSTETDYTYSKVVSFIKERTGGKELQPEEDIFATGYVNSLFIVQLITWLEKVFKFSVDRSEMDIKNFRSIGAITRLVRRHTGVDSVADGTEKL